MNDVPSDCLLLLHIHPRLFNFKFAQGLHKHPECVIYTVGENCQPEANTVTFRTVRNSNSWIYKPKTFRNLCFYKRGPSLVLLISATAGMTMLSCTYGLNGSSDDTRANDRVQAPVHF